MQLFVDSTVGGLDEFRGTAVVAILLICIKFSLHVLLKISSYFILAVDLILTTVTIRYRTLR